MELKEWYEHPDLRRELSEALEIPCVKIALGMVTDRGIPALTMRPDGTDLIQWNALQNARHEGYFDALKNLKSLTKPLATRKPLPGAWESEQQTQ